jgi:hypothetical protein
MDVIMSKCQKPNYHCHIRFTMHLPDDVNVLDLDWSPLPEEELRRRAAELGKTIERDEDAYLRQRLAETAYDIWKLRHEREEFRRKCQSAAFRLRKIKERDSLWQKQVRELLGVTL